MFTRHRIQLIGDRVGGEEFTAIRGKFLLIERCDIPCEFAIDYPTVYLPAREGMDYRGQFRSVFIRHPAYSIPVGLGDSSRGLPEVSFVVSDDSAIGNYFSESVLPGCLPYDGGSWPVYVGIASQVRAIKVNILAGLPTNAGLPATVAAGSKPRLDVWFTRDLTDNIQMAGMNYRGVADFGYLGGPGNIFTYAGEYLPTGANNGFAHFDTPWIPVPSGATVAQLTCHLDGLGGFPLAFTGDNANTIAIQAK